MDIVIFDGPLVPIIGNELHIPDDAIDVSRDTEHMIAALHGDEAAWNRMSKGRRDNILALDNHKRETLLAILRQRE